MAGTAATRGNLITSLHLDFDDLEKHVRALEAKYKLAEQREARAEEWCTADAEIVLVGYGIVGRILKAVTAEARADGIESRRAAAHHAVSVSRGAIPAAGIQARAFLWWWR